MSIPEISGIAAAATTSPVQAQAATPPAAKHGHGHGHGHRPDTVSISPQATQLASAVSPAAEGGSSAKAK
jgi:hypothetical protein